MWVSVTRDRIRIAAISHKDRQRNLHERVVTLIEQFLKIVATFLKFPHPINIRGCHLGTYIGISGHRTVQKHGDFRGNSQIA